MPSASILLRLGAAIILLVAGGLILWAGLLGMWGLPFLFGPEDKPTLIVLMLTCILIIALGAALAVTGLGMIVLMLGRAMKVALQ